MFKMARIRLAWRNLFRNYRRTILSVTMVVSGYTAIVVFQGFAEYVLGGLRMAVIELQLGHLQVARDVAWNRAPVDNLQDKMIVNPQEIANEIKKVVPANYVSSRVEFYGIISTNESSVSARAMGFDPSVEIKVRDGMEMIKGKPITTDDSFEIMLGDGLEKSLQVEIGDRVTILSQTVDGAINAIDTEVVGVASTGVSEIDNVTFYLPIKTAQKLLDTDRVDRLIVSFDSTKHDVDQELKAVQNSLPEGYGVKAWKELAFLYRQTEEYFSIQNRIVSMIILVLVLLSISNIVSNAVVERTGEIGTMRALGDRRRDVLVQFFLEGFLLSILSGIISIITALVVSKILTSFQVEITIPGATRPMILAIPILIGSYVEAFFVTSGTVILATFYPAWQISRVQVIEALKRNV
jgi:putative ABC transport system permease protein